MSTVKSNDIVLLENIKKDYGQGKIVTKALRGVDLKLVKGDFTVMMGPSGSGKSTLLNIIGGLDRATSGKAIINGVLCNPKPLAPLKIIKNVKKPKKKPS